MIQIIKNDLIYLFLENKKQIIIYFILMLLSILFLRITNDVNEVTYYILDGLVCIGFEDEFSLLFFFYNLIFLISLVMKLFIKDIQNGKENIFLRINLKNWTIVKFISIFICTFIFRILYMLFVSILLEHKLVVNDVICEIIYVLLVLAFTISSLILKYRFKIVWIVIPAIFIFLLFKYGITHESIIDNSYKLIGTSFITIIFNYIFTWLLGLKIFEAN